MKDEKDLNDNYENQNKSDKLDDDTIIHDESYYDEKINKEEVSYDTDNNKTKRIKKEIMEWIKSIAVAAITAFLIVRYIFAFTVVNGNSMYPTLHNKDRLIEIKIDKLFRTYRRGDIVVLKDKVQTENNYYVKRIIGEPGELVEIYDGKVFINGEELKEYYIVEGIYTDGDMSYQLSNDEYFVMGDNREKFASRDSRSFGPIKKSIIGGRCVVRVFPFDRIGGLK